VPLAARPKRVLPHAGESQIDIGRGARDGPRQDRGRRDDNEKRDAGREASATESKNGGTGGERTGLKTRHYMCFHGADQEVPEVARLIQSIVWEPE